MFAWVLFRKPTLQPSGRTFLGQDEGEGERGSAVLDEGSEEAVLVGVAAAVPDAGAVQEDGEGVGLAGEARGVAGEGGDAADGAGLGGDAVGYLAQAVPQG